ncbi:nucleoid occlusion protein [Deinococcus xinjiangensis]|uniref:Nucleoid occlusion protein n=1 Tax=Deinococcus xinjiangensis TaxID=457454 RepID=A0ABP9V761_9DEIO
MTEPLFATPTQRTFALIPLSDIEPPQLYGARRPHGPSVKTHGVLTPIELVSLPAGAPYLYRVAAGARRWAAALDEGLSDIPAFVSDTPAVAADLTGIENLCRSPNPIAEALALKVKLTEGYDLKAVSARWGAPIGTLKKLQRLLLLPEEVLTACGTAVSLGVVQDMANLEEPYRSAAVQAFRQKVAHDPDARFTADDLKAVRVAEAADFGDLLEEATQSLPAPLLSVDPLRDLAARVFALCRHEGVDAAELARFLLAEREEEGTPLKGQSRPVVLTLDAASGDDLAPPRPPARVRLNQWKRGS